MLSRKGKWIVIITGLLTILLLSSQILQTYSAAIIGYQKSSQKVEKPAGKEDPASDTASVVATYEAVIPILKVHTHTYFYLVLELILLCKIEKEVDFSPPLYSNNFLVTLFQHIICANAP